MLYNVKFTTSSMYFSGLRHIENSVKFNYSVDSRFNKIYTLKASIVIVISVCTLQVGCIEDVKYECWTGHRQSHARDTRHE